MKRCLSLSVPPSALFILKQTVNRTDKKMNIENYYELILELISEAYQKKDSVDYESEDYDSLPIGSISFKTLSPDEIKTALGRKWREQLPQLRTIVELFKFCTPVKRIGLISISCTARNLLNIFKSPKGVSRAIQTAKKVGLIQTVEDTYHFGFSKQRAKKYAWNKTAQNTILALCRAEGIEALNICADVEKPLSEALDAKETASLDDELRASPYRFRFTAKTRMANTSDKLCIYGLEKHYPQLADYMKKVAELNKNIKDLDEKIQFVPNITRNKGGDLITKIGIRATSKLVSTKDDDKDPVGRAALLHEKFGTDDWTPIDVKASVPRVTYLLNRGEWLDWNGNGGDLYAEMFGRPFDTHRQRTEFKNFFMRLYFSSSEAQTTHQLHRRKMIGDWERQHGGKKSAERIIGQARNTMICAIGKTYESEIFLHESAIYIDVFSELVRRGYRVIQIYDCFYIRGILSASEIASIHSIIKDCAEAYYGRYIAPQKTRTNEDSLAVFGAA